MAGPVIGLFVPTLLIVDNRVFGVSSSLRQLCSAVLPSKLDYFRYDWKRTGLWNLSLVGGILVGGFLAPFGAYPCRYAVLRTLPGLEFLRWKMSAKCSPKVAAWARISGTAVVSQKQPLRTGPIAYSRCEGIPL